MACSGLIGMREGWGLEERVWEVCVYDIYIYDTYIYILYICLYVTSIYDIYICIYPGTPGSPKAIF